ncbi:MAG: methylmalonyl-CoA mutase [Gammaproteobacteria bacterium]|nr:methylmalonyl-CoA mutase [Gammaproteobacteria bacterium]NIR90367.1 methylmalonyl-CoA mutase [Gammaproteobacteria bacterium]NIU03319.1 methylmalonyl-CoA mutase [Gammaproteobacteria bacterium]NIV50814.1 methylmalonyl-CoA mutase [Gammaproteobacteria bacterium]NIW85726.1 methylmalonyl-CoA mutase [Gammaproteobacteria bacterium]
MNSPIKVLLAKPTQACHDRGVRYLARRLTDAGFGVIFSNFLLADELVSTALQEDVDVVGVSSSSGGHMPVFEDLVQGLRAAGLSDVLVIGGGVIPAEDAATLHEWGVGAVFGPGSSAEEAVDFIRTHARPRTPS